MSSVAAADLCVVCGGFRWRHLFRKHGYGFARCSDCSMVSVIPLPSADDLTAHQARCYTESYYKAFAAAEDIREAIAVSRFEHVRKKAPAGRWLEVGCGTGAFLRAAARAGYDVEGIDLSAEAVEIARAGGLRIHQTAIEDFRPRERYAVVAAFDVIEHLRDPAAFVRAARDWLQPGGHLALTLPDVRSWMARSMGRWWFQYWPPDHVHYFARTTVSRLLDREGFTVVDSIPARKPITLSYIALRLRDTNPAQSRLVARLMSLLPARWRERQMLLPTGEMLVTGLAR